MKKQIIIKFLSAIVMMAVSMFIVNIQAQDVTVAFVMDPVGAGVGGKTEGGIGGRGTSADATFVEAEDPRVELNFEIGPTGQISLDAFTPSNIEAVINAINNWDNAAIGATTNSALFGKSFSLVMRGESRMQLGFKGGHGIGIQGSNQGRLDDEGDEAEWMEFTLGGDVGIGFTQLGFTDVTSVPHVVLIDHDTQAKSALTETGKDVPIYLDLTPDDYRMRYFTDKLRFATDSSGAGYRVYSLAFNVNVADPKPPAVIKTTPVHADTTIETTSDYIIHFDVPMDQTATQGAVTFTPDVANRANAWNDAGDELTISYDQLPYATDFVVLVSTDAKGTNALNMLADTTFAFKTLPEPPAVVGTFPENLAVEIPVNTPFEIQFSKGMVTDSVEKAIEFTPAIGGMDFIWNADNSTVYFSTDQLQPKTQYFVTVTTVATDLYGVQFASPSQFVFTTANIVGIENDLASKMVIYPNPVDDMLRIQGVDVKSVEIYSVSGQLMKREFNTSEINVMDIHSGIYVISVSDKDDNRFKELVIIK